MVIIIIKTIIRFISKTTNKLRNFISSFRYKTYYSFNNNYNHLEQTNDLHEFLRIIKKCKTNMLKVKNDLSKNGVETVFKGLFESVENYLSFEEEDEKIYKDFEKYFKNLFFTYIWSLQDEQVSQLYNFNINSGFKNKLSGYMKIITLNYDTILDKILNKNKRDIIHWHGSITKNKDGTLNYSKCLLHTIRNPKSLQSFPQLLLFKNFEKYKNQFELDILGLNPINDENAFALFINSKICKKINFYYYNQNDLKNLDLILKKIKKIWLKKLNQVKFV